MEIIGRITDIKETQLKGEKQYPVREFVCKYRQTETKESLISFTLLGDKTELIDSFAVGEIVKVKFNIDGREYNEKVYNTIAAYSISKYEKKESVDKKQTPKKETIKETPDDDLPF